jgi:ferredoxin-NADP reductase
MAMLRHHRAHGSQIELRMLVSARSWTDVLYRDELAGAAGRDGVSVSFTLTRERPAGWSGFDRRIDAEMLKAVGPTPQAHPKVFVCGPTPFVENAADLLVSLGHPASAIRTERFGPTGG